MIKFSVCLFLLLFVFTLSPRFALAHSEYSLPQPTGGQVAEAIAGTVPLRFLPSHPLYFLILAKENVNRIFQASSSKRAQFDLIVAGKRVKETYLLIEKEDIKNASKSARRYSQRLKEMVKQLEKARSQNQEVEPLVAQMAESLRLHEILLTAIYARWQSHQDQFNFDENFSGAIEGFSRSVATIDNVKPGLKDRFKTLTESTGSGAPEINPTSPPTPAEPIQATASAKPRRIIY